MGLIDFDKLAKEYQDENDFGFSAVSEEEYNTKVVNEVNKISQPLETMVKDYQDRLDKLERMIVPFLTKLHSTGDKEYIYWPNRKPVIENQIEKIDRKSTRLNSSH